MFFLLRLFSPAPAWPQRLGMAICAIPCGPAHIHCGANGRGQGWAWSRATGSALGALDAMVSSGTGCLAKLWHVT